MAEHFIFHATMLEVLEKRSPDSKRLPVVLAQLREAKQARLAMESVDTRRRGILLKFPYLEGKIAFLRALQSPAVQLLR